MRYMNLHLDYNPPIVAARPIIPETNRERDHESVKMGHEVVMLRCGMDTVDLDLADLSMIQTLQTFVYPCPFNLKGIGLRLKWEIGLTRLQLTHSCVIISGSPPGISLVNENTTQRR